MNACSAGALRNQELLRSLHAQQGKQALQSVRSRVEGTAVHENSMGWQSSRYRAAWRVPEAGSGSVFPNIMLHNKLTSKRTQGGAYDTVKYRDIRSTTREAVEAKERCAGAMILSQRFVKMHAGGWSCMMSPNDVYHVISRRHPFSGTRRARSTTSIAPHICCSIAYIAPDPDPQLNDGITPPLPQWHPWPGDK